jgi:site-specific recombinase XerD
MEDMHIPLPPSPTKFLDQFRVFIRTDGKSYSTENTYVYWVKQFILFNNKAHPKGLGNQQVEAFLTHLSVAKDASQNTQKLALNALMFLYNRFLNSPIEQLNFMYAKKQIQTLMGHTDIRTTEIYLHVLDDLGDRVKSPLDA